MKTRFSILLLALGLAVGWLGAPPAWAQTGAVEGFVKDEQGKALEGITIEIIRTDVNARYEVKTDKKGYYVYMGLPAGPAKYNIRAVRDGEVLWETTGVRLPTGAFHQLDFDLKELRQEAVQQLTEEQKRQLEERQRQIEQSRNLQEIFNRGRGLMDNPSADLICTSRCGSGEQADATCLTQCREELQGADLQAAGRAEAIRNFQRAAEIDATQYAVWANLALAHQQASHLEESIEAYQKAIELKPDEASLYLNVSQLYARAGLREEAWQACEKCAALHAQHGGACYYNIGVILYNANDLIGATEPLQKAVAIDPGRAPAYYLLGMSLFNQAEYKQEGGEWITVLKPGTKEAFEKYLELAPDGPFAAQAKEALQTIEATLPASLRVNKKK